MSQFSSMKLQMQCVHTAFKKYKKLTTLGILSCVSPDSPILAETPMISLVLCGQCLPSPSNVLLHYPTLAPSLYLTLTEQVYPSLLPLPRKNLLLFVPLGMGVSWPVGEVYPNREGYCAINFACENPPPPSKPFKSSVRKEKGAGCRLILC